MLDFAFHSAATVNKSEDVGKRLGINIIVKSRQTVVKNIYFVLWNIIFRRKNRGDIVYKAAVV